MNAWSLSCSLLVVTSALAVLLIAASIFRRETGLTVFALGFIWAALGYFLLLGHAWLNPGLGLVLSNLLMVLHYLFLAWGMRIWGGKARSWPWRFWLYLAACLTVFVLFSVVWPNYNLRVSLESGFVIIFSLEFLVALTYQRGELQPSVINSTLICVGLFIMQHLVRIILAQGQNSTLTLINDNRANSFWFIFNLFFIIVWAGLILLIEVSSLMRELEKRNSELRSLATTDELTGLHNRHLLENKVKSEMERSVRYGEPLSLIMFDIDHFKDVNDSWGHQAGDAVLRQIAQTIKALIREPDNLFRWGGEEFMILAPHTGLSGASSLAEKLRLAIANDFFPQAGRLSASFGVAQWQIDDSQEHWFRQVDFALYQAKNKGRNQVVCWQSTDTLPIAEIRLEWQAKWESGHPIIDMEHRELVEMASKLLQASLSHNTGPNFGNNLSELLDHIKKHFTDEEELLRQRAYPDIQGHIDLHRELSDEAQKLMERSRSQEIPPAQLFDFLVTKVIIGHLLKADALYFPYVK